MANEGVNASLYLKTSPTPWSHNILKIKHYLESFLNFKFDYVLMNYYRDGNDCNGYHSDKEAVSIEKNVVASLSLGHSRRFLLKHKIDRTHVIEYILNSGSLLLMLHDTQKHWLHSIPKEKRVKQGRINLTFRKS